MKMLLNIFVRSKDLTLDIPTLKDLNYDRDYYDIQIY